MKKTLLVVLSVLLLGGLIAGAYYVQKNSMEEQIENAGQAEHGIEIKREIKYGEQTEKFRRQLRTVLFIGIDGEDEIPQYTEDDLIPFVNYQQADFLTLMVIDDINRKIELVQINRDTMTYVPWLGVTGEVGGYVYEQIALSHNFGSGLKDSCINTCNAVSRLLFKAPIDHYIMLSMGAVPVLNDSIGGVKVTVEDDLSSIDPSFVPGSTVTLIGDNALKFVRARADVGDQTNVSRMRRQRAYINGYIEQAKAAFEANTEILFDTVQCLDRYMLTDMSTEALAALTDSISTYEKNSIYTPAGESVVGEKYMEFYPDIDSMWMEMKRIFC